MKSLDLSFQIARTLSAQWSVFRGPDFHQYVISNYQIQPRATPAFECLYIAETETGDVERGYLGGVIRHWWKVDDQALQGVQSAVLDEKQEDVFDRRPIIKFYYVHNTILIGERLGPDLVCRKVGLIGRSEKGVDILLPRIMWSSTET